jgi:hypothetical protein
MQKIQKAPAKEMITSKLFQLKLFKKEMVSYVKRSKVE